MHILLKRTLTAKVWAITATTLAVILFGSLSSVRADNGTANNAAHMVTIYDRGVTQTIITKASTVRGALEQARIDIEKVDIVEPSLDEALTSNTYNVNVYRARPVLVQDGQEKLKTVTAAQSPAGIAKAAHITLYPEDKTNVSRVEDVLDDGGAALKLVVDRATEFSLVQYGKRIDVARTQATTVGAMLKEKGIILGANDGVSVPVATPITKGMSVSVWRNGKQTVTQEEVVTKPIEEIKDAARELSFREVKIPGTDGTKNVTYEIDMRDGVEVSRTVIATVVTKEPVKEVVTVGAKLPIPTNPSENAALGHQMMLAYGFSEDQWPCLYNLWKRESGWRTTAGNTSSGAYGIPQSLPASKMASVGGDYLTNAATQITWGLGYVKGRYHTPCGAWASFQSKGWY